MDKELQQLLRRRRTPVDEQRLEEIRESLHRRGPRRERREAPGFFPRHWLSLSFGSALVLIGLIVWRLVPFPRETADPFLASSRLLEIVQDEGRVEQALVLLNGFASASSNGDTLVQWDVYDRSLLGYYQEGEENVLQALYGSI